MTERELEKRASIAKFVWLIGGCLLCIMALLKIDLLIILEAFVVWWASVIPLMHYFPDDLMRTRQRQGF